MWTRYSRMILTNYYQFWQIGQNGITILAAYIMAAQYRFEKAVFRDDGKTCDLCCLAWSVCIKYWRVYWKYSNVRLNVNNNFLVTPETILRWFSRVYHYGTVHHIANWTHLWWKVTNEILWCTRHILTGRHTVPPGFFLYRVLRGSVDKVGHAPSFSSMWNLHVLVSLLSVTPTHHSRSTQAAAHDFGNTLSWVTVWTCVVFKELLWYLHISNVLAHSADTSRVQINIVNAKEVRMSITYLLRS